MVRQFKLSVTLMSALVVTSHSNLVAAEEESFSPYVNKEGAISLPADFRSRMAHLGSWFVPSGDASGFHDVYADETGVHAFRKTGKFADGTIVIKELRASKSGDYTTGKNVHYADMGIKQWFVMVKDTQGRFQGNMNWGDGWGWALFKSDKPSVNVSTDYKVDCLGCHAPARNTDWIYLEGYPTLTSFSEGS